MTECPKCKKDITYFEYYETGTFRKHAQINKEGYMDYTDQLHDCTEEIQFDCPHCNATLFESHDDAEEFLKGEHLRTCLGCLRTMSKHDMIELKTGGWMCDDCQAKEMSE